MRKPRHTLTTFLYGPREEVLFDEQLEYREANVKTYRALMSMGSLFGSDYTVLKEFLGIACIAAALREHQYDVSTLIASNEDLNDDAIVEAVVARSPDVFGVSLLYDLQLLNALQISRRVKERLPDVKVVFGGAFASVDADELVRRFDFIDFVIRGEGELAALALYQALGGKRSLEEVPGLTYRYGGALRSNPVGELVDLSRLPVPARDVLSEMKKRGTPIASAYLYSSRGCQGSCVFCTAPQLNRSYPVKWRSRAPAKVVDEIAEVAATFKVRTFYFTDDNFYGYGADNKERLHAFADELIRRKLSIEFHAECRVDGLDEDVLIHLKAAGLRQLLLGLESGSNVTLRRWGKQQTVEDNERAIRLGRKHKFDLMPSVILLDWESSPRELKETIEFIVRNRLYEITYPLSLVNKLHILRGTAAAFRYAKKHPGSDDLEISDEDSMRTWIVRHTFQDVKIEDPYVATFWKNLSAQTNRWYLISQEFLPGLLLSLRRDRRRYERCKESVHRLTRWRAGLGMSLVRLMGALAAELDARGSLDAQRGLDERVRSWVEAWEREIFPKTLEHEIAVCQTE